MATETLHDVEILRRTRATGGKLLLPGKTYKVIKSDFLDLVRSRKGVDPSGNVKVPPRKMSNRNTGEEMPGGRGEGTQEVGTRTVPIAGKKAETKKPADK